MSLNDDDVAVETESPEPPRGSSRVWIVIGLVALAFGVLLRLRLMLGRETGIDSDEATVGLMAVRFLKHGELSTFFWDHVYGGGLEAVFVAPFVKIFGTTKLGLRSTTVSMELITCWLTWRVAKHLLPSRQAAFAGIVALFWPLALIWFGVKEGGFYSTAVVCGMTALLMAVNINEKPELVRHWVALGFATGLGLWMHPNILYYALPILVWMLVRRRFRWPRNCVIAGVAFLVGSAPWLRFNLDTGWASLEQPNLGGTSTWLSRFEFFWSHGFPFALGLRAPFSGAWYQNPAIALVLYAAALVAIVLVFVRTPLANAPDLYILFFAPFIYASFISNWQIVQGRYSYVLASILPVVLGRIVVGPVAIRRAGTVFVALLLAFASYAFAIMIRDWRSFRPSVGPMVDQLEAADVHTVVAPYWTAYLITYDSDERIVATPIPPMPAARYRPYVDTVLRSAPAYVFPVAGPDNKSERLIKLLDAKGIGHRDLEVNGFVAVIPDKPFVAPI